MFQEERHNLILKQLEAEGKVLVRDLAEQFSVTEDSIRKDLAALEAAGKLKRTYGGALSLEEKALMTKAHQRRLSDVDAKRRIASAVYNLLKPAQLIYLDCSSISIAVGDLILAANAELKILTNMIELAFMLARNPKVELYLLGGRINQSRDAFSDTLALDALSHFKPDISFIGASGVDFISNTVTTYSPSDGVYKGRLIDSSKEAYVMAEARKIGIVANYAFAEAKRLTGLITDTDLSAAQRKAAGDVKVVGSW